MRRTQLTTLMLLSFAFSNSSLAQAMTVEKCATIASDEQRLQCFDSLTGADDAKASANTKHATDAAASQQDAADDTVQAQSQQTAHSAAPKSAAQRTREFGLENRPAPGEEINKVSSKVVKVEKNRRGNRVFTLANGMVWQQKKDEYFHGEVDDMAIIKRGFMGVFYLGIEGTNRRVKVERLQ